MAVFHPYSNIVINSATGSGKSSLLKRLLLESNTVFNPKPSLIIYVYKVYDNDFEILNNKLKSNIQFLPSLPTENEFEELVKDQQHVIFCVYDALELTNNSFFVDMFTYKSHHYKTTPIIITQHLQNKGKFASTILQNTHVHIMLPSPRDQSNILSIGRQLGEYNLLRNIFQDIRAQGPFKYLIINLHPAVSTTWRYVTNILQSDNAPMTVYLAK